MLVKRIFDFLMALIGFVVLLPAFILLAIIIKLDSPGPVFFRQTRVGQYGQYFKIYKFRTMAVNAEAKGQITVGQDNRITQTGHLLRRYKLDELPQLINVLRGDMSLVGPRPEVPRYVEMYPENIKKLVLSVPPGITDWAAIEYRDESAILGRASDPEKAYVNEILPIKLQYYVRYVEQRSFFQDMKIVLITLFAILR